MKLATLMLSLFGLIGFGLTGFLPAQAEDGTSGWDRSELIYNEEYDEYRVVVSLDVDIFQERMVWSDHYTDFVPVAMAYQAELRDYTVQMVWNEDQGDFVPRAMVEPCPRLNKLS
ncbi:MAG: hypothetical protein KBF24_04860 [Thiobacillaceae bacterium]|jgi:hypothetical protein|nr:hypothetical protein [Thiobacillaceae bacterium]